ncbi:MAG TPA: MerR family DNA-binding transcriptional regulator [Planctomycetota bacterium]|nr:MerR family DNA-binding transcriptional regulator [Planctomycetota bacterium]
MLADVNRDGERRAIRVIPKKLYKIGEVMRHSGLSRQTIHNYTMLGLLTEDERTESGHRLYGENVFERIERIKALRGKKTLKEIIQLLKEVSPS